jgi:hypothetical protein
MLKTFSGVVLLLLQKLLLLLWFRVLDKVLITASQTATAALVAGQVDGVFAKVLYDNAAIGGYIKVTGTTVTSATSLLNVLKSIL